MSGGPGQDGSQPDPVLVELLTAQLDGALTSADRQRLESLLSEDANARRFYVRYLTVHAQLSLKYPRPLDEMVDVGPLLESRPLPESAGTTMPQPNTLGRAASVSLQKQRTRAGSAPVLKSHGWRNELADWVLHPIMLALLLACVSGGVIAYSLWSDPRGALRETVQQDGVRQAPAPLPGVAAPETAASEVEAPAVKAPSGPLAQVTQSVAAHWEEAFAPDGMELTRGKTLRLTSGLAEITFASQATMIVQGPSEVVIDGPNACSLRLGKLTAHVPVAARGFRVRTPTLDAIDLGTEFGVEVKRTANMEVALTQVEVFEGKVAVEPPSAAVAQAHPAEIGAPATAGQQKSQILTAGQGVVSADGSIALRTITADPTRFVRELPAAQQQERLASWPKDSPLQPGNIVAVTNAPKRFHCFKIDPRSGKQTLLATGIPYREASIDHGQSWSCVGVEPDGNVLVGAVGLGAWDAGLLRIDPRNGQIKVAAHGGLLKSGGIVGLAIAADGTIYAAYKDAAPADSDFILRIDPSTGQLTPLARFGSEITGISWDVGARNLLATSSRDSTIGLLRLAPEPKLTRREFDRNLGFFNCVAVNHQGRIFVGAALEKSAGGNLVTREQKIIEVDRDSLQPLKTWAVMNKVRPEWLPMSLACEADGNLVVNVGGADRHVYRVDTSTGKVTELSTEGWIESTTFLAVVPGRPSPGNPSPAKPSAANEKTP